MSNEESSMYMWGSASSIALSSSKCNWRFFKSKINSRLLAYISNPSILLRPNRIFYIFINFTETNVQKIILAWYLVTMTTLSYKFLCVKFYDIFKTTICLPVLYLTLLQPMCIKYFVSYPHDNGNMSPDNYVCIVERHF